MKCKHCGNDLFPEQFICEECGHIVEAEKEEVKEKKDKKETKK